MYFRNKNSTVALMIITRNNSKGKQMRDRYPQWFRNQTGTIRKDTFSSRTKKPTTIIGAALH